MGEVTITRHDKTAWWLGMDLDVSWGSTPHYSHGFNFSTVGVSNTKTGTKVFSRKIGFIAKEADQVAYYGGRSVPDESIWWYNRATHKRFHLRPVLHLNAKGNIDLIPDLNGQNFYRKVGLPDNRSMNLYTGKPGICALSAGETVFAATKSGEGWSETDRWAGLSGYDQWRDVLNPLYDQGMSYLYNIQCSYQGFGRWKLWFTAKACIFMPSGAATADNRARISWTYSSQFVELIDAWPESASESFLEEKLREKAEHYKMLCETRSDGCLRLAGNAKSGIQWSSNRVYWDYPTVTDASVQLIFDKLEQFVYNQSYVEARMHDTTMPSAHNFAFDALQNIGICDNNGLAYIKDTLEAGTAFIAFANTLSKLAKGAKAGKAGLVVKAAAAAYLSVHYGYKLTYLDTKEYLEYLSNREVTLNTVKRVASFSAAKVEFGGQVWQRTGRFHIYYDTGLGSSIDLNDEVRRSLDLDLTTENAWDMVPFSFVIDWFYNIGKLLTSLDNYRNVASTYRVVGCCQSISYDTDIDVSSWLSGVTGRGLHVRYYERGTYDHCPTPIPSSLFPTTSPFKHLLEGASLIVTAL